MGARDVSTVRYSVRGITTDEVRAAFAASGEHTREFAARFGVSIRTVQFWLAGTKYPDYEHWDAIRGLVKAGRKSDRGALLQSLQPGDPVVLRSKTGEQDGVFLGFEDAGRTVVRVRAFRRSRWREVERTVLAGKILRRGSVERPGEAGP